MIYEKWSFWLCIISGFLILRLLQDSLKSARAFLIGALNLVALGAIYRFTLPWLFTFLLFALLLVWVLQRTRKDEPTSILISLQIILPLFLVWMLMKQAVAFEWVTFQFLSFVGSSYLLIKVWTLTRDLHSNPDMEVEYWSLFAYLFHFPTYLMGPMHYYSDFRGSLDQTYRLTFERAIDCIYRILLGLLKIKLLVAALDSMSLLALVKAPSFTAFQLLFAALVFSILLWADFSGTCDIAIATSRLMGIDVPENFHYPYAAKNIREFWQRWHISFSRVLTQYIFIPLSRFLQKHLNKRTTLIMVVSYMLTFLLCGIWHSPTPHFAVWGLYHGLGMVGYDLFRKRQLKRRMLRKKQGKNPSIFPAWLSNQLARVVTFLFVSIGWIFFVIPLSKLSSLSW